MMMDCDGPAVGGEVLDDGTADPSRAAGYECHGQGSGGNHALTAFNGSCCPGPGHRR
jgi:hypothetical protein